MSDYTYEDIITAKDILTGKVKKEDIIGKNGWFTCSTYKLRRVIEGNASPDILVYGRLDEIKAGNGFPCFYSDRPSPWDYFIPEKEKSYKERQAEWIKKNDLKPGDKVRILRRFERWENGVPFSFNDITMTDLIGEICEVFEIADNRIRVYDKHRETYWVWPYFCLEKVEPEYVPFDLSKEEDRLKLCGSWVKSKRHPDECHSICGVSAYLVFISGLTPGSTAREFLRDFTFLDGSPCGKPANGQQIAGK